eukprot:2533839-Pleurochrysis_carterae.AAC.1
MRTRLAAERDQRAFRKEKAASMRAAASGGRIPPDSYPDGLAFPKDAWEKLLDFADRPVIGVHHPAGKPWTLLDFSNQ